MVAPTANPATANTTEDDIIVGSLVSSVVDPNNGVLFFRIPLNTGWLHFWQ